MTRTRTPRVPDIQDSGVDPSWYRDLVESAPDAVVLIDSSGRMVLANAQTERLFGHPRAELMGQPVEILIPERYRKRHGVDRDSYFGEPKVREMGAGIELWGLRKDGTEFPLEISLSPLRTERGVYATASIRDISDRKKAQQQFRALLETAPDAMVIIDQKGVIQLVNAQTERLFGYQREALVGKKVEILIPERLRDGHVAHRTGYFTSPKVRGMGAGRELSGRRKDGTEFPIEISLSPLETAEGVWATAAVRDISERKKAEQRFRTLLESAPDAMVIINQRGEIMLVNAQTEHIFGYRREQLIGQRVEILVPERLRKKHVGHREGYFAAPKIREMGAGLDLWGLRSDGTEFPIEISLSPMETEEGVWATAAVRDVTERKREQDTASRLAAIVGSSNDAILGKALDGTITSWNKAAERLYGYTAEEIIGRSIAVLAPPEKADETRLILERIGKGEHIQHFETVRMAKGGRLIDLALTISPIYSALGKLVGASTIARDISDRKKAEARFRTLLETAPDAMVIINRDGLIELVNEQAERIFGYTREEMVGQRVELLVPERLRDKHVAHRSGYFHNPKVRPMGAGLELWGRRKSGEEFPIEISLSPMETAEGSFATAAVRDISERKAVEEKLARYAESLKQSNEELEQFAYVASHDLQAPLRNVVSFTQLLEQDYRSAFDQKGLEYLQFIVQSGVQMQALIRDLLAFSRVGRQDSELASVDTEQVFGRVLTQLKTEIAESKAQVTHDPLPPVHGVAHELNQLLQNLMANAIKFQPGGNPRVHVSAERKGAYWQFSVRDWGIGIKPEHHKKIFQIFQRLHTTKEYDGTGIGLALCQKIVTRHGGRIWVESDGKRGTTFHFTVMPAG